MIRAKLRSLWNGLFRRSNIEKVIAEELQFHIEARAEDLSAQGVGRDEALRRARLELGSVERYKEEMRQARGSRLFDELRYRPPIQPLSEHCFLFCWWASFPFTGPHAPDRGSILSLSSARMTVLRRNHVRYRPTS